MSSAGWQDPTAIRDAAVRRLSQQIDALDVLVTRNRGHILEAPPLPTRFSAVSGGIPRRTRLLTLMFVDIRNSARIEEMLLPEQTVHFLSAYLGAASTVIADNDGAIYQFVGDGLIAMFGTSGEIDHGASRALAAAIGIHGAFARTRLRFAMAQTVHAMVAIHTGLATIGVVDLSRRSDFVVVGDVVNVTSRLESEGKSLGLSTVLTGETVRSLSARPSWLRHVGTRCLRGISHPVELWAPDAQTEAFISTQLRGAE